MQKLFSFLLKKIEVILHIEDRNAKSKFHLQLVAVLKIEHVSLTLEILRAKNKVLQSLQDDFNLQI